jgi:hypothetical protein
MAEHGDLDGAAQIRRAWADTGDAYDGGRLADLTAELLAERGDLDELRGRADTDGETALRLARLLEERGDLDGLRARACPVTKDLPPVPAPDLG